MNEGDDGLLGLYGYKVSGPISEDYDRIVVPVTQTLAEMPRCDVDPSHTVCKWGQRVATFRDLPIRRRPTYLVITRKRHRCEQCRTVFYVRNEAFDDKRDMTLRFRKHLEQDAVRFTFTMAGEINEVDDTTVRRVFEDYAERTLKNYTFELPRVLGVDEKYVCGKPRFVVGDVASKKMLDMRETRLRDDLVAYFSRLDGRENVEVVTLDMYKTYRALAKKFLPNATPVVDKFHVIRYANLGVEAIRKRIQAGLDNEGRVAMKRKIRLLAARPKNLGEDGRRALKALLAEHPLLDMAVTMKEWFYELYEAPTRADAEAHYRSWMGLVPAEMEGPFGEILRFMKSWNRLIFNYFEHRYTNVYVETLNGLIDTLNRAGRGHSFKTLRAKALLKYGDTKLLIDRADYSLAGMDPDEQELFLMTSDGHGIDLSTWEHELLTKRFW